MPEYLAPGVYVEEVSYRPKSIQAVGTSTTGFVGPTRRGPLLDSPEVITSYGEFERIYGGLNDLVLAGGTTQTNYMAHAVRSYFNNGGTRLYIGRVFVPEAGNAGVASSAGIDSGDPDNPPQFRARMAGSGLNGTVTVFQKATPASMKSIESAPAGTLIRGTSVADEVTFYRIMADGRIQTSAGETVDDPSVTFGALRVEILTMNIEAVDADGSGVFYEGIGFDSAHPRSINAVMAQNLSSKGESLQNPYYYDAPGTFTAFDLQQATAPAEGETAISYQLTGGNDGIPMVHESVDPNAFDVTSALELLEDIEDIAIIAAPGHSALADGDYRTIQSALITHAEQMKYRIAVLDTPPNRTPGEAREAKSFIDSKYGALYYPWCVIKNPLARPGNDTIPKEIALPPSGFVTGIYARTDIQTGVWKAPANEVVQGVLRFEREINKRVQETLNPEGINCLRYFPGRGLRVWGARTISSDPEWNYVNIRRYFIYLEHSIDRSTQWAVFEPNGERLWANIRQTIEGFMYNEWTQGALLGSTPEEAYFVVCDRSTMTQADLDAGRLICEIGVAAVKPAEFVIFRIGQKTADSRG